MSANPAKLIASAIQNADKSYFFEDYTKQASAVLAALDKAGFQILPKDLSEDIYLKIANEMRTGKMSPEEHIRDVYATLFRILKREGRIS